jgi:hypothetical protein
MSDHTLINDDRSQVKFEGQELTQQLTDIWSDDVPFSLEMALVVNKVTYAILNCSERHSFCLSLVFLKKNAYRADSVGCHSFR